MTQREKAIKELIQFSKQINDYEMPSTQSAVIKSNNKLFQKYMIRDIVFLAIITCCTLVTGAIMPLLVNIPRFGIIQLG